MRPTTVWSGWDFCNFASSCYVGIAAITFWVPLMVWVGAIAF
ncbi:MAG: hypothetical protein AAGC93_17690 [Cyanobacteria bacterium P01_F01_bin.53]